MNRVSYICMGLILSFVSCLAADENTSEEVKLSLSTKRDVQKLIWPIKVMRGSYKLNSPESFYGNDIAVSGKRERRGYIIQLDCDGDGKFSRRETKTYKSGLIGFMIPAKLADKTAQLPLVIDDIFISRNGQVYGRVYPGWAMSGSFGKKKVYLIDANLDAKFTTDGRDYIAIDSQYAIPLSSKTSIDGKFYDLSVAEDGSNITFTKVEPKDLCEVTLRSGLRGWQVVAITNNEGTYNIAADDCNKVPPGEYRLKYGLYGNSSNNLYLRHCDNFEIRSGNQNILNIGKAFSLKFTAKLSGSNITVDPQIQIVGISGEEYVLNTKAKRLPPPSVTILAGRKRVASGNMEFG